MFHWGSLIVPTGYTHPVLRRIGGNPYGLSLTAPDSGRLTADQIEAARFVGGRIARMAARYVAAGLPSARELWAPGARTDPAAALAAADSRHA
ncbi:hypothetical protein ABZW10_38300 [Kitasatospora sp. NPDC004723]|uniref:hypothetical protein n=1 Tax=Kitasatospora sp. NPDC004723 TaxID=3154288 RepID=UPI0033B19BB1